MMPSTRPRNCCATNPPACFGTPITLIPVGSTSVIMLIPRMKSWVATNYPGTKIGITEYNWGAEPNINGATAQADILGIFGREGLGSGHPLDHAGPNTSPTYKAMKMYRNYDGNKSIFRRHQRPDHRAQPGYSFGLWRRANQRRRADAHGHQQGHQQRLAHFGEHHQLQRRRNRPTLATDLRNNVISHLTNISLANGVLSDLLPAQSITLLFCPRRTALTCKSAITARRDNWASGSTDRPDKPTSSNHPPDLVHWSAVEHQSVDQQLI